MRKTLCILSVLLILPFAAAFAFQSANRAPFLKSRTQEGAAFVLESVSSGAGDSQSSSRDALKTQLLDLIPKRPFGAPATNITTDEATISQIEDAVLALEAVAPNRPLSDCPIAVEALDGDWQLVYSDASEITRIVKLPLGFSLGPVFQPINVTDGRFENQALIKHKLRLASGHTRVVANFSLAPKGEVNRAGVVNDGNRANVKFQKVIFSLRRFLFFPTFGKIRKTAIPKGPSEKKGVIPCIDITYLDEELRISRGGDGSLFILVRADGKDGRKKPMPMLQMDASEIVVDEAAPTYDASKDILPSGGD